MLNDFLLSSNKEARKGEKSEVDASEQARAHAHAIIIVRHRLCIYIYKYIFIIYLIVSFHSKIKLCTATRFQSRGSTGNTHGQGTRSNPAGGSDNVHIASEERRRESERARSRAREKTTITARHVCVCVYYYPSLLDSC